MIDIGRICVKLAGRDARMKCVVLDVLENNYVLIDGQTRRKKCNMAHLEPLDQTIEIEKNADHATVVKKLKDLGIEIKEKNTKQVAEKPTKKRKSKA
ncbi:MAG: 50S ribosomal protein L14e [Candidatus Woesearchaeota archaeon]